MVLFIFYFYDIEMDTIIIQKDGLQFVYTPLDETNEERWKKYYDTNSDYVKEYFAGKKRNSVEDIQISARDTANGFLHLLRIAKEGNKESAYRGPLPTVISGVAYITPQDADIENDANVIISVGVFTTREAAFYVMVGISLGFRYRGPACKGLSKHLTGFVASIMGDESYAGHFGKVKQSFITRPLQKMSEIFKEIKSDNVLNIDYDKDLELPNPTNNSYSTKKTAAIIRGEIRKELALKWLKQCEECNTNDDCSLKECVGDIPFFILFVGDIFSPRWPYTGRRVKNLKGLFEGGGTRKRKRHVKKRRTYRA